MVEKSVAIRNVTAKAETEMFIDTDPTETELIIEIAKEPDQSIVVANLQN